MKLLILSALFLSATAMDISPILFHYLCSNGYMSPSDDINSLLNSPTKHGFSEELVQIVTDARKNTQLLITTGDDENVSTFKHDSHSIERNCLRNVLETSNTLKHYQLTFMNSHNRVDSLVDMYFFYWAKRDLDFMLSIKPYKNKPLTIVLQSLLREVLRLIDWLLNFCSVLPTYSESIMNKYRAHGLPSPRLPPMDVKWAKANSSVDPKVHFSLLSELLQRNIIEMDFITSCKENYYMSYKKLTANKSVPADIFKRKDLDYSIANSWLAFWLLGMRIRRVMPSPTESALGPGLIESFNMEIKFLEEVVKEDKKTLKHVLECSCLHINYLIVTMKFALLNDLLNHHEHFSCVDLILTHREVALKIIAILVKRVQ